LCNPSPLLRPSGRGGGRAKRARVLPDRNAQPGPRDREARQRTPASDRSGRRPYGADPSTSVRVHTFRFAAGAVARASVDAWRCTLAPCQEHPPRQVPPDPADSASMTRVLGASRRRGTASSGFARGASFASEPRPTSPLTSLRRKPGRERLRRGRARSSRFRSSGRGGARPGRRRPRKGRTDQGRGARASRDDDVRRGGSPDVRRRETAGDGVTRTGATAPRGRGSESSTTVARASMFRAARSSVSPQSRRRVRCIAPSLKDEAAQGSGASLEAHALTGCARGERATDPPPRRPAGDEVRSRGRISQTRCGPLRKEGSAGADRAEAPWIVRARRLFTERRATRSRPRRFPRVTLKWARAETSGRRGVPVTVVEWTSGEQPGASEAVPPERSRAS